MDRNDNDIAESVSIAVPGSATNSKVKPAPLRQAHPGEISDRGSFFSCPVCNLGYKCHFGKDIINNLGDGIARVLMSPPCGHKFIVFVDGNLRSRGVERVDHEGVKCEFADASFLEGTLAVLEEKHATLLRSINGYNEAFETMQQIKATKKEIAALRQKVVAP
jgi:hypothetical protein